jgi:UMF1 family MFS transporter
MTEYFGLYALTGKVTSFVGPLAVGALTTISGSQRVGISIVVLFFVVGAVLLAGVRPVRDPVSAGSAASR